jgi:hypothetical protein
MGEPKTFSLQNTETKLYLVIKDHVSLAWTPDLANATKIPAEQIEAREMQFKEHGPFNRVANP